MDAQIANEPRLSRAGGLWRVEFSAMASSCELLFECADDDAARRLARLGATEAARIEARYSRYCDDSLLSQLNAAAGGAPREVDEETANLLDYAATCHELSGGLFDITSGVLRLAWRFDGGDRLPSAAAVAALLPRIGWHKVHWQRPYFALPEGMQIDFGGIGKEYAVDRVLGLLLGTGADAALVNFGGDLAMSPRRGGEPWRIGVECPDSAGEAALSLPIGSGALATSGDACRYLLCDGVRYGHVLDPRSGWPVKQAARSITVAAGSCTEAGMLATLALLRGAGAEGFLIAQGVRHWVLRD